MKKTIISNLVFFGVQIIKFIQNYRDRSKRRLKDIKELKEEIKELRKELKKLNEKSTIIVVSHDIGFISGYVTRVACLNQTLICHETAAISGKTIEELYGGAVHMIQHSH